MDTQVLSVFAVMAALSIQRGYCISCYTCSSWNDTNIHCHDPFNPAMSTYTENCMVPKEGHIGQFPANFCIKIIGKTISDNTELVIRVCTLENMDNQCGVFRFEDDTLQGCILTCDYDGCNNSIVTEANFVAVIIATVLLIMYKD